MHKNIKGVFGVLLSLSLYSTATVFAQEVDFSSYCAELTPSSEIALDVTSNPNALQERLFIEAGILALSTNPSNAAQSFTLALQTNDESPLAYFGRGCALLAQGDDEGALADFDLAREFADNDPEFSENFHLGTNLEETVTSTLSLGGGKGGDVTSTTTNQTSTTLTECVYSLYISRNYDTPSNAEFFVSRFNENTADAADFADRARAYSCLGEIENAIADYTTALEEETSVPDYFYERGVLVRNSGDYEAALPDFEAAIALEEDWYSPYAARAYTYYLMRDYESCVTYYTEAIEVSASDSVAFGNLGLCYDNIDETDLAIENYDIALEMDPDNAIILGNRGMSYTTLAEYDLALDDFSAAIEIDPLDPYYFVHRGDVYLYLEDWEAAQDDFDAAIDIDPTYPSTYYYQGVGYYLQDQIDEAVDSYETYLELAPEGGLARWVLEDLERIEQGLPYGSDTATSGK